MVRGYPKEAIKYVARCEPAERPALYMTVGYVFCCDCRRRLHTRRGRSRAHFPNHYVKQIQRVPRGRGGRLPEQGLGHAGRGARQVQQPQGCVHGGRLPRAALCEAIGTRRFFVCARQATTWCVHLFFLVDVLYTSAFYYATCYIVHSITRAERWPPLCGGTGAQQSTSQPPTR